MRRGLMATAAALLLAGCSTARAQTPVPRPGPEAPDGRAMVGPRCGLGDEYGPTFLTMPTSSGDYPQLSVVVLDHRVENTTVTLPARNGERYPIGRWCTAESSCRELTAATVAFGARRPDRSVPVTIDARLPDGARFTATRLAQPRPRPTEQCG